MENLAHYGDIIASVLVKEIVSYRDGPDKVETVKDTFIRDDSAGRYLLVCSGWYWHKDQYDVVVDVEVQPDGQIVIHRDILDEDLAEKLIKAGLPAASIVKAYEDKDANDSDELDDSQRLDEENV